MVQRDSALTVEGRTHIIGPVTEFGSSQRRVAERFQVSPTTETGTGQHRLLSVPSAGGADLVKGQTYLGAVTSGGLGAEAI